MHPPAPPQKIRPCIKKAKLKGISSCHASLSMGNILYCTVPYRHLVLEHLKMMTRMFTLKTLCQTMILNCMIENLHSQIIMDGQGHHDRQLKVCNTVGFAIFKSYSTFHYRLTAKLIIVTDDQEVSHR